MNSNPLRVLQVALSLDPGGTEKLIIELVNRLHHVVPMAVCCLDHEGAWASQVGDPASVEALHRDAGFIPSLGLRIADAARRHRANVIHAHHYSPFVYAALARIRSPHLKLVYTEHGRLSDAAPSHKRQMVNTLLRRIPHRVFAVSDDLRQHMLREGFLPNDVAVIYNGIDVRAVAQRDDRLAIRRRLGVADDVCVVMTIARLDPVKDLGTLLRAIAEVHERQCLVVIIGDGPERHVLERLTTAWEVTDRVRFLGQRDDARDWLPGCDIYVNSSISEGVSLTILEAMSAGCAVIATRVGGTPEIIDESSGELIPARDASALTGALLRLADDDQRRKSLGAAARRRVEAHFTIERMIDEYHRVYRHLTGAAQLDDPGWRATETVRVRVPGQLH